MKILSKNVYPIAAILFFFTVSSTFAANLILVSGNIGLEGFDTLLTNAGHTIDANSGSFIDGAPDAATLTGVDLVIFGKQVNSANYDESAAEIRSWIEIGAPMLVTNVFLARESRFGLVDDSTLTANQDINALAQNVGSHPFLNGLDGTDLYSSGNLRMSNGSVAPGGTNIVSTGIGDIVLADYAAGTTFTTTVGGGGSFTSNNRIAYFGLTSPFDGSQFSTNGETIFLQTVDVLAVPEPSTYAATLFGILALVIGSVIRRQNQC